MRTAGDPGLWLIAAAMLCGVADVPGWFTVPAAVIGMPALTLPLYLALWDRARAAGAERRWSQTLSLSVGLAVMIAGGAYLMGRVVARVWGVL